ncbi:MAG: LamG-like jellyroll fold domain-containing protein, partial [Elusimicrobiota bacterium]
AGKAQAFLMGSGGSAPATSARSINNGAWHHVALVRTQTLLQVYVDGQIDTQANAASVGDTNFATSLQFAAQEGGSFLNGSIDEVRIFNVARSSAQILAEYQNDQLSAHDRGHAYAVAYSTDAGLSWNYVSTQNVTLEGSYNTDTSWRTLKADNINLVTSTGPGAQTNRVAVMASDYAGNVSTSIFTVFVDTFIPPPMPTGCGAVLNVAKNGMPYSTIQSAVLAVPPSLSTTTCVVIRDTQTYSEQVSVRNIQTNTHRIRIMADPSFISTAPVVNPPVLSTAAFVIANSSVSIENVLVVTTNSVPYGVFVSSQWVSISSASVQDNPVSGNIYAAGIALSSANWSRVSYSSVTVQNARAFYLDYSSGVDVSHSTGCANLNGAQALYLNNASSSSISDFFASNPLGNAGYINASSWNDISRSTFAGADNLAALNIATGTVTHNTFSQCAIWSANSDAMTVGAGFDNNTITRSTLTAATSAGYALIFFGEASHNTLSQSFLTNSLGGAVHFEADGNFNTLSQSTMIANILAPKRRALYFYSNSSSNTVSDSFIYNSAGAAMTIYTNSDGNTIIKSTMIAGDSARWGLYVESCSSNLILDSYIQGSTAVYVANTLNTRIGNSTLVSISSFSALWVNGNSDFTLTSSTLRATPQSEAAFIEQNSGLVILSTNTILGGQYGLRIATQTSGAQLWITSNTMIVSTSAQRDTYGLYFDGLRTGATIQNNSIVLRQGGSLGSYGAYGIYAKSAALLNIDHNRVSNPGLLTGGSFIAAYLTGSDHMQFKFNDFHSTGTGLTNAHLLWLANTSTVNTVKNNIFSSSVTVTAAGSSATVRLDGTSQTGFASDYNDFFSSNSLNTGVYGSAACQLGAGWTGTGCPSQDANSIAAHPQWFAPEAEDFHPRSAVGRFRPATQDFFADTAHSLTIDAADIAEDVAVDLGLGLESAPNGGFANQGSYGRTAEASRSALPPSNPVVSAVYLSSITVSYGLVGAGGYVVEASTRSDFRADTIFSSSSLSTPLSLSPQSLDPNTTYYLRAGALWGKATSYALTVPRSTSTLAKAPQNLQVYATYITSMTANWTALPGAALEGSSSSCLGYILKVSSYSDFSQGVQSSVTYNVGLSTLSASSLYGGKTYYFRAGSYNHNGVPNFGPAVSALLPVVLSVTIPDEVVDMGTRMLSDDLVIATHSSVLNDGNVRETYNLRVTTTVVGSPWAAAGAPALDQYTLWAIFNTAIPNVDSFQPEDRLTHADQKADATRFSAGAETGADIYYGTDINIWFRFTMPTGSSTRVQQDFQVTVTAEEAP